MEGHSKEQFKVGLSYTLPEAENNKAVYDSR